MKKSLILSTAFLCAMASTSFISCKKDSIGQNVSARTEEKQTTKQAPVEEVKKEEKIVEKIPGKPSIMEKGLSKFYVGGKIADILYVDSGAYVRRTPDLNGEVIGHLPNRFPAKIVSIGNKCMDAESDTFWIEIAMPDYTGANAEPVLGWIIGSQLAVEEPEYRTPETSEELAEYISELPILVISDNEKFSEGKNLLYFYHDGSFDYYIKHSEEEIEKKFSGSWETDSSTHVILKADDFWLTDFFVHDASEDHFRACNTDGSYDGFIFTANRDLSFGFLNERMLKNYKYAWKMDNNPKYPEKIVFFNRFIDDFKSIPEREIISSGVDLSGTKYEEAYRRFWDPIREKHKRQPTDISGLVEFHFYPFDSIEVVGSHISPMDGNTFDVHSDFYKESEKIGTFEPGQIAIVKNISTEMVPPIPFTWIKIIILDNGIEGWILEHNDDPDLLTNYHSKLNYEKETHSENLMNATVSHKMTKHKYYEDIEHAMASSNYVILSNGQDLNVYTEHRNIISHKKTDSRENVFAISDDESKIFILQKHGCLMITDTNLNTLDSIILDPSHGSFTSPIQIAVSPNERYIYMENYLDQGARVVPQISCYDRETKKLYEYDFRTPKDSNNGYNSYSKIIFNDKNEALVLVKDKDSSLIRFTPQSNGEITTQKFDFPNTLLSSAGFAPDGNGYIAFCRDPYSFVKISRKGEIIEDSRKFTLLAYNDFEKEHQSVQFNRKLNLAAVVSKKDGCSIAFITIYSTRTLNPLYTFSADDNNGDVDFFLTDNGIISCNYHDKEIIHNNLTINEKKDQISVSPKATPKLLALCKNRRLFYMEENRYCDKMYASFSPFGIYLVSSYTDDGYEEYQKGFFIGSYAYDGSKNITLNRAFHYGPDEEAYYGEKDAKETFHNFSPVNNREGKMVLEDASSDKISCYEFAK